MTPWARAGVPVSARVILTSSAASQGRQPSHVSDYNWSSDRLMIIVTLLVCGIGLIGVVAWFLQRRCTRAAPKPPKGGPEDASK